MALCLPIAIIELLLLQHGEVNLSLDAVGPKFDEVRRGGVWARAEPGLKRFLAARDPQKLAVGIYPTVTRRTIGEAVRVLDWAAEHDVDIVVFHRYSPIQDSFEERPSEAETDRMRENLAAWTARNDDRVRVYFEGLCLNSIEPKLRKTLFASDKHAFRAVYAAIELSDRRRSTGRGPPLHLHCARTAMPKSGWMGSSRLAAARRNLR